MKKFLCLFLVLVTTSAAAGGDEPQERPSRWSKEQAWAWYKKKPWLFGVNYGPTTGNPLLPPWKDTELDTATVDRELQWAQDIGVNSIRIWLTFLAWEHNPPRFMKNLEAFVSLADKHRMSFMPVLFDDCSVGAVIFKPNENRERRTSDETAITSICKDPAQWPRLKAYVRAVMEPYRADGRIIMWDLYNEPANVLRLALVKGDDGRCLLEHVFTWAREVGPTQPLTAGLHRGYQGRRRRGPCVDVMLAQSDVFTFHLYGDREKLSRTISLLKSHGYPLVCTEWFARALGSSFEKDLPVFKEQSVGNYFFGLVHDGFGTFIYPWPHLKWPGKEEGKLHPTGWFHNIFHPDGRPYRQGEIDAIRRIVLGK